MLEISIVTIFLILNLFVGLYYGAGAKTIKGYSIGEKKFSTLGVVSTITATYVSGDLFISYVTEVYKEGLLFIAAALSGVICLLIIGWYLVPRMVQFSGTLSVAEAMGRLYGKNIQIITACASISLAIGMTAVQVKVFSLIFSHFFHLSDLYAVIISTVVVATYSAFGGIKSVVFTDILQFFTFSVFLPTFALFLLQGFSNIEAIKITLETSSLFNFNQQFSDITNSRFLSHFSLFLWCLIPSLNPTMFQRILISKDYKQARKAFTIAAMLCFLILVCIIFIAVVIFTFKPDLDPNLVIMHAINSCPFIWLKTFAMIGIMAMVMSTSDSWINSSAVIFTNDICKPLMLKVKNEIFILRLFSLFMGAASVILALSEPSLLNLALLSANLYMPVVTVPLLLAIGGIYTTPRGVGAGMLMGGVMVILWKKYLYQITAIDSVIPGMATNLLIILFFYLLGDRNTGLKKLSLTNENKNILLYNIHDKMRKHIELIKSFNLSQYARENLPKKEATFVCFGFYTLLNILPTFGFSSGLYSHCLSLITAIQSLTIFISVVFIFCSVWPVTQKNSYFPIIWYCSVFISLGMTSSFLFLLNPSSELSLIILILNFIVMGTLLSWIETLIMMSLSVVISLNVSYLFIDNLMVSGLNFKMLSTLFLCVSVIITFVRILQNKYLDEKCMRDAFQQRYFDLEKIYIEIDNKTKKSAELGALWEQKVCSERIFVDLLNKSLKICQIKSLLNKEEYHIHQLPIIVYEKIEAPLDLEYYVNILRNFIEFQAKKDRINISIECLVKEITLNISPASIVQIIFSLVNNVADFIPEEETIEVKIDADDVELNITVNYSGFGLTKTDLLRFIKNKKHINPFLLTWPKFFEMLELCAFWYEISVHKNGGQISISRFLSKNVYKMPMIKKNTLKSKYLHSV